ncbi:MAG: 30S ribosomal protein S16 [Candidatus Omnitrophica bacterium]|nr:30S ribosomal protein S16 [Candidatus Omnitrophota bacterium]
MSVVIRMKRMGTKRKAFSRIVVTDSRSPRDGRFIEELGYYDMRKSPHEVKLNKERVSYWLKVGAQPSATVKSFLKREKIS